MTLEAAVHTVTNRDFSAGDLIRPVLDAILNARAENFAALAELISAQTPLECSCGETCAELLRDTDVFSQGVAAGVIGASSFAAASVAGASRDKPLHVQLHQTDIEIVRDDRGRVSGTREKEGTT